MKNKDEFVVDYSIPACQKLKICFNFIIDKNLVKVSENKDELLKILEMAIQNLDKEYADFKKSGENSVKEKESFPKRKENLEEAYKELKESEINLPNGKKSKSNFLALATGVLVTFLTTYGCFKNNTIKTIKIIETEPPK